jgi:hypothetical protein
MVAPWKGRSWRHWGRWRVQLLGKAMPAGFAPHMQKLVGSKPNCLGRCVTSSSIFVDAD